MVVDNGGGDCGGLSNIDPPVVVVRVDTMAAAYRHPLAASRRVGETPAHLINSRPQMPPPLPICVVWHQANWGLEKYNAYIYRDCSDNG